MAEKAIQELERIYTIPLRATRTSPRNHQADRAIRHVKNYLRRHMKADDVWLDTGVNEKLWARGMYKLPSRIRVRAVKFDDGVVEVSLPEAKVKASIRAEIQERREKAEKEKEERKEKGGKKEEKKAGTEEGAAAETAKEEKPGAESTQKQPAQEPQPAPVAKEADKAEPTTKPPAKAPATSDKGST